MTATVSAPLTGSGGLRKTDAGTLVLSGINTYAGDTSIDGGTLAVSSETNLGASTSRLRLNSGGALQATADMTSSRAVILGPGGGTFETETATGVATTLQLDGTIANVGSLTKTGTGTLLLTANNRYFGGTTISAGTLQLGNGGTTGSVPGPIVDNGALVIDRSNQLVLSSAVSGSGTLEQRGAGTTILSANNTYTGGTLISGGTLQIGNGGTTGDVVGDIVDNGVLVVNRSDTKSIQGVISGSGRLVQGGTGTLVLAADNNYAGGTSIDAGTLQLGDGGTAGSVVGDVHNNSVLAFNRSDEVAIASAIDGNGSVQQIGPGKTILTGANTYLGGTTVSAGSLQVGNGGTTGQIFGDILNNGTVILDRSDDLVYTGSISGTGNTIKNGAGTMVVTGTGSYTGGTTINAGVLQLGNGGTSGSVIGNIVDNAALVVDRSDSLLLHNAISGSGRFEQAGTGTTVLEADNTYGGGTTISNGTLQIGNGGITGSVIGDIVDDGVLVFNRADTLTLSGLVSGGGELVQAGLGTLIMSNTSNSYSSGTAIESGVLQISADAALGAATGGLRMGGGTLRTTADITTSRATVLAQEGGVFDTVGGTVLTHTGTIDGAGGLTKTGGGTLLLTATNDYAGGTEVGAGTLAVDAASATSTTNLGGGDVDIAADGTLAANTAGAFNFDNALTGTGLLTVSNSNAAFSFGAAAAGSGFAGTVALASDTFALTGNNTAALTSATLAVGNGSEVTVGPGAGIAETENIGGLRFDGGKVIFNAQVPADVVSPAFIATSGTLDISGTGTLQVDVPAGFNNTQPLPDTSLPLLAQDDTTAISRLVQANGPVIGTGGALTLLDQNGNPISNGTVVSIDQGGTRVAQASYDFNLISSSNGVTQDGLYVGYGLKEIELDGTITCTANNTGTCGGAPNALVLTPAAGATGLASDLGAKVTGSGDLVIAAGAGASVSLSNRSNDYTGTTYALTGTLLLQNDNALGRTSDLRVASGAAVDTNGYSQHVGAVDTVAGGMLTLASGSTLTVTDAQRAAGTTLGGGIDSNTVSGAGSFVIDPSVVYVNGDQPGYTGTITVTDGSQLVVDSASAYNNAAGIVLAGATDILTFGSATAYDPTWTLIPNGSATTAISGAGTVQVFDGARVTFAGDNSGFSGRFSIASGSAMTVSTGGNLGTAAVANAGEFHVDTATDWQIDNAVSGTGTFYKEGPGRLTAGAGLTYSGDTLVNSGTFAAGAANSFSRDSAVTVAPGAALDANGLNQTVAVLSNAGTVNVASANADATPGAVLAVVGNYVGNNGTVVLGTQWGNDGAAHDQLAIAGNASGTTALQVLHRGGSGDRTDIGIDLVKVGGSSTTDAFALSPASDGYRAGSAGVIAAGPYDYTLKQGGNGGNANDWYLVSSPAAVAPGEEAPGAARYRPEVGSYLDNRLLSMQSQWHTLHDRQAQAPGLVGDTSGNADANSWARLHGSFGSSRKTDNFDDDDDSYLLHLGSDVGRWNVGPDGSVRAGVMGMLVHSSGTTTAPDFDGRASQSIDGVNFGAYATWYGRRDTTVGPYVDVWLLGGSFDNKVRGSGLPEEKYHAQAYSASLEAGYGVPLHDVGSGQERTRVIIQPQAQVIGSTYRADNHIERNGTVVSDLDDDGVSMRLGVRLYAEIYRNQQRVRPFAEVNWWHGSNSQTVALDGIAVRDGLPTDMAEFKLGVEGNVTRSLTLWGSAEMQRGSGYSGNSVSLGLKYAW
ncbi:autotransporter outer membrane beta-barrel domain-containing protein [Uliginosibacterium sp. sgz301328]|uniref:autotransporter outer membrane beta-barrel domain-containing protein n=1 Tax=Uliginosibacterium sp. sgz301328 TaxID=3243764 RepID=UPI00359E9D09